MLNGEANSSWRAVAESWPEHHKWSTTSLVIYSVALLLLMGREASISGCMWVSKEGWGDLRVISYLERVALPASCILGGRERGWRMWEEGRDRRAFRKEMDWSLFWWLESCYLTSAENKKIIHYISEEYQQHCSCWLHGYICPWNTSFSIQCITPVPACLFLRPHEL